MASYWGSSGRIIFSNGLLGKLLRWDYTQETSTFSAKFTYDPSDDMNTPLSEGSNTPFKLHVDNRIIPASYANVKEFNITIESESVWICTARLETTLPTIGEYNE